MSIQTHIAGVYHSTASLRIQSWWIKKYGKRVARLKAKIHHTNNPRRRERLEKKYKHQMAKLNEAIHHYEHSMRQASHHIASLKTEY